MSGEHDRDQDTLAPGGAETPAPEPEDHAAPEPTKPEAGAGDGGDGGSEPPSLAEYLLEKFPGTPASPREGDADATPDPSGADQDQVSGAEAGEGGEGEGEDTQQAAGSDPDALAAEDEDRENLRDLSEAELQQFKPKTRKRLQALLQDRAKYRERVQAAEGTAERFQPIERAMSQAGLEQQEVGPLLEIGALIKRGDWQGFLQRMQPVLEHARVRVGEALPPDVQQMVDDGEMTPERAKDYTRARLEAQQHQAAAERAQTTSQAQERQAQVNAVRDALNAWEGEQTRAIADYAQLKPVVSRYVQAIMAAEGAPTTAEDARKVANRALEQARTDLKSFVPRKEATPPRPSTAGAGAGTAPQRKPQSMEEAIARAMNAGSGA